MNSLLRWIHHDLAARRKLLSELMSLTRLHHLPAASLKVQAISVGIVKKTVDVSHIVFEFEMLFGKDLTGYVVIYINKRLLGSLDVYFF